MQAVPVLDSLKRALEALVPPEEKEFPGKSELHRAKSTYLTLAELRDPRRRGATMLEAVSSLHAAATLIPVSEEVAEQVQRLLAETGKSYRKGHLVVKYPDNGFQGLLEALELAHEQAQVRFNGEKIGGALSQVFGAVWAEFGIEGDRAIRELCVDLGEELVNAAEIRASCAERGVPPPSTTPLLEGLGLGPREIAELAANPTESQRSTSHPFMSRAGLAGSTAPTHDFSERGEKIRERAIKRSQEEFELPQIIEWPVLPASMMGLVKAIRNHLNATVDDAWIRSVAGEVGVTPESLKPRLTKLFGWTTEVHWPKRSGEKRSLVLSCRMLVSLLSEVERSGLKVPFTTEKAPSRHVSIPRGETS